MTEAAAKRASILARMEAACRRAGRDADAVMLVAVSKTVPAGRVREILDAGQTVFGENRVQEALGKMGEVGPPARWHLVGHLQRNKARHAVGAFDLIHSVDDLDLAREIDRRAEGRGIVQPVLVEVNVAGEESKEGIAPAGLDALLEGMALLRSLDLQGLMTIPPPAGDPGASRPWFRELARLRDDASRRLGRSLPQLSMGMSDDFEVAIEEGATLVRVGRALFGERLP
ncbi:MAG TPA: YggS family pyridoxal phosphate-dependent enzyme [Candidatus Polarisedimenticolaceae bacterium]|nr:YggS family pyridoxal phosphate-dependent enzyme [Candidatus Polarisedimenticolaceae bacterium]